MYEHESRLWAKSRCRRLSAADVHALLTGPICRGRYRAEAGQLLLFTTGLPEGRYATSTRETA